MTRTVPPVNVDYWALRYSAGQDDESDYVDALGTYDDPLERAQALWDWKDLSRGVDIGQITTALTSDELAGLVEHPPGEAVEQLGDRLVERGALANRTVVTPAFLLHLADSGPDAYSTRFPIFDVRCWVAYVYLTGMRSGEQSLPRGATSSPSRFGDFSEFFQRTIPDTADGRRYEQALFRFGAYISSLPVDTITEVDEHLRGLEAAVTDSHATNGFALVQSPADSQ